MIVRKKILFNNSNLVCYENNTDYLYSGYLFFLYRDSIQLLLYSNILLEIELNQSNNYHKSKYL